MTTALNISAGYSAGRKNPSNVPVALQRPGHPGRHGQPQAVRAAASRRAPQCAGHGPRCAERLIAKPWLNNECHWTLHSCFPSLSYRKYRELRQLCNVGSELTLADDVECFWLPGRLAPAAAGPALSALSRLDSQASEMLPVSSQRSGLLGELPTSLSRYKDVQVLF